MKITVPLELDVNLTPNEIISYLTEWMHRELKIYKYKNSYHWNSTPVVRNNKLYWAYREKYGEIQYEEIPIEDKIMFDICKNAVLLINSYRELTDKKLKEETIK